MQTIQLKSAPSIQVEAVVRTLPGRRDVLKGTWSGQEVFAKIFIGKDAQKYAKRDAAGIAILQNAGIATPKLLFAGDCEITGEPNAQAIVLEEIKSAKTADEIWPTLQPKALFELATQLVETIAQHHLNEIVHTDLHLNNFLVAQQKIYTLDGDGVREYADLMYKSALKNLAELISKFDVLEQEAWLPKLLESYQRLCTWHLPMDAAQVAPLANKFRLKSVNNYAKKVFRNCTDVHTTALKGLSCKASSRAKINIPKNAAELDALMLPQNLLKNGNTCTVALAEIDQKKVVIKRYNIKSFWHSVSRAFRQTRAAKSWANAHRLKLLNIATAAPIALIESKNFGLNGKAYFLAEFIDAPDALEFFNKIKNKSHRAATIQNIATLFYKLFLLQISHGDMKATNIKIVDDKPRLIDLDAMQPHASKAAASKAHARDLRRFMQNWQSEPALYNAFVKAFKTVYADNAPLELAEIEQNK